MKRFCVVALLMAAVMEVVAGASAQQDEQAVAQALWDQAIAAKGGRARLEGVRNLVVTKESRSRGSTGEVLTFFQRLYVFPAHFWEVADFRPVLGVGQRIFDLEHNVGWGTGSAAIEGQGFVDWFTYDMLEGQFLYLLETPFLKPSVSRSRSGSAGRRPVDIVETTIRSEGPYRYHADIHVDYYIDRQSHLPVRAEISTITRIPQGEAPSIAQRTFKHERRYNLGNYVDVDGLQMPTLVIWEGVNDIGTTSYRINVDYDERVFTERPPNLALHPELAIRNRWERK